VYASAISLWCWVGLLLDLAARGRSHSLVIKIMNFLKKKNKPRNVATLTTAALATLSLARLNFKKLSRVLFLVFLFQSIAPGSIGSIARAATLSKEQMNLFGLLISSPTTINTLELFDIVPENETFELTGTFSELGFTSTTTGIVNNSIFNLNYTGTLVGDIGNDINISINSNGTLGNQVISTSGNIVFPYDENTNSYSSLTYEESGSINPGWFVIIGLCAFVAFVLTCPGDTVRREDPPPVKIIKEKGQSVVVLNPDGTICRVVKEDPIFSSSCTISNNNVAATFVTASVPDPSSILSLLALGTLGAGATLKRQLKPSKSTEKETTKVG
jgi:hypothetical protein